MLLPSTTMIASLFPRKDLAVGSWTRRCASWRRKSQVVDLRYKQIPPDSNGCVDHGKGDDGAWA